MRGEDEVNLPTEKVDAVIAGVGGAGMDAALPRTLHTSSR